ncbi:MAG TPA: hypothetical protein VH329_00590 [Solirubrobacterales bacterium]
MASGGANWVRNRAVRLALALLPILFAVPVAYALIASLADVLGSAHPFFGDISGVNADARSISLGGPLYQSPDVGYTPLTYTPFMSVAGGLLDLITVWDGWLLVLTILADVTLITLAAVLAYRRVDDSPIAAGIAIAGAIGMGAMGFWLVGFVPFNSLYAPRPDQLAWAFALTGLVLVPGAARGSAWAGVGAVAALSLGWWTKQPALVAPVAGSAWLALAALRRRISRRSCLVLIGSIVAVGVVSFGLAAVLTDGWSTAFTVDMPADRATPVSLGTSIHDLITSVAAAAVVAGALWIAALAGRPESGCSLTPSPDAAPGGIDRLAIAEVLAVFIALDAPAALYFRQAVGSTHNQFVGIAWALALLAAVGWALARRARGWTPIATGAVIVAAFAVSELSPVSRWLHDLDLVVPPKEQRAVVFPQPAALLSYSKDHLVYHPGYAGIGVDAEADLYPDEFNVNGLNRAGRSDGYLERALLERRFDLVYPFTSDGDAGPWEANYLWKLNQVIAAKYEPAPDLPEGLTAARAVPYPFAPFVAGPPLVRRPGPDPAPWMSRCFAPFEIRGTDWTIGDGGGFWCRDAPAILDLRASPAAASEIRADGYNAPDPGTILIAVQRPGSLEAEVGDSRVSRSLDPRHPLRLLVPEGSHGIRLSVSTQSRARVDLGGLAEDPR